MTTITPTDVGLSKAFRIRTGTAQADTGQTDWLRVPRFAKYGLFYFDLIAVAGTTPVLTPSFLSIDPVTLEDGGLGLLKVAEHAAFTGMTTAGVDEVQTLTLTAGAQNDTFKLTWGTVESSAITIPSGGYANVTAAQVKAALLTNRLLAAHTNDLTVTKNGNDYVITFSGDLGDADQGAITVTSATGTAAGSVAETTKGVPGSGLVVAMGVGVTGIADDVTNSATAKSYVSLNTVLPPVIGVKVALDRTTGDETYTYTVSGYFGG